MQRFQVLPFVIVLLSLLVFSACKDSHHDDDHTDAFGVAVFMGTTQVAIQQGGTVSYTTGNHISLSVGETSPTMSVQFINDEGGFFVPEDEDYFLRVQNNNTAVLNAVKVPNTAWDFNLVGVSDGEAQIRLELVHVNHADFQSQPFIVVVE